MGAIRPGSGGGGGASALGDLSDIGTMGEPIGQADDLTEVVTAMGGAAAVRTALDVAQDGATITYTLGGTVTDYTADAAYAPSGLTTLSGGSVSARLGDGTVVPYFSAIRKSEVGALARNSNGVRLTLYGSNSASGGITWPYANTGCAIHIPLDVSHDVQIDATVALNFDAMRGVGGTDLVEALVGVVRRGEPSGRPAYLLGGTWLYSYYPDFSGVVAEYAVGLNFATTDTQRDVSSSGEGTVSNITVRDVRVILKGNTVEVLTGPTSGALTRRIYYADVELLPARDGLAFMVSLAQAQSTPQSGYYCELRELVITPL